jgi:hypothetical protein
MSVFLGLVAAAVQECLLSALQALLQVVVVVEAGRTIEYCWTLLYTDVARL